ncbi:hypothetical protein HDV05_008387 [Chytridiales sp. JEL 0842]|nr:hypothetical protein HDV05_008387 [Chytridiales sp. JEL 0842]
MALTPPFTLNDCIYLDAASACGSEFYGSPIEAIIYPTYSNFTTTITQLSDPLFLANRFAERYGCLNNDAMKDRMRSVRYIQGFWCSELVYYALAGFPPTIDAQGVGRGRCRPPQGIPDFRPWGPLQCQQQCSMASGGLNSILSDPALCPNLNEEGRTRINLYTQFCTDMGNAERRGDNVVPGKEGSCIRGSDRDIQFAGYADAETALRLCPSQQGDADCASFLASRQSPNINNTSTTTTLSSSSPSATTLSTPTTLPTTNSSTSPTDQQQQQQQPSGPNMSILAPILAAVGGILLLAFIVLFIFLRRRHRKRQQEQTSFLTTSASLHPSPSFSIKKSPTSYSSSSPMIQNRPRNGAGNGSFRSTHSASSTSNLLTNNNNNNSNSNNNGDSSPMGGSSGSFGLLRSPSSSSSTFHQQQLGSPLLRSISNSSIQTSPKLPVNNPYSVSAVGSPHPLPSPPPPTATTTTTTIAATTTTTQNNTQSMISANPASILILPVLHPYEPTLPDELPLQPGMQVLILKAFDDGWALGKIASGEGEGREGAFPLVCVTSEEGGGGGEVFKDVRASRG